MRWRFGGRERRVWRESCRCESRREDEFTFRGKGRTYLRQSHLSGFRSRTRWMSALACGRQLKILIRHCKPTYRYQIGYSRTKGSVLRPANRFCSEVQVHVVSENQVITGFCVPTVWVTVLCTDGKRRALLLKSNPPQKLLKSRIAA
jgi:hypothetical protein